MYGAVSEFGGEEFLMDRLVCTAEELKTVEMIEFDSGLAISPVAPATVIVTHEDGIRLVSDAVYGCLPNGMVVLAVHDEYGVFPFGHDIIDARVILDPYTEDDDFTVTDVVFFNLGDEEFGADEDEDEDDDEKYGEDEDDDTFVILDPETGEYRQATWCD